MERKRKRRIVYCEFQNRGRKIRTRTLVVSRTWIRKEMVRNSHVQAERGTRSCRGGLNDQLQWKRTSRVPWIQCFRTRIFAKQRRWTVVFSLLWWYRYSRRSSSHDYFRQSVQCLGSSSGYVWRTGLEDFWMFRKYRETCSWGQIRDHVSTHRVTTTKPLLTNETVQGNLLREYDRKFANVPDDIKLIRLFSNAGFIRTVAEGEYFVTLDDAELAKLGDFV